MRLEQRVLDLFLNVRENEIRPVAGRDKILVDAALAAGTLPRVRAVLKKEKFSPLQVVNLLDALTAVAPSFKNSKYIYYNGRVFMDCFAPGWPGKVFDQALELLLANLGRGPDQWQPYIPSLIFAITKKCVYRCEHCYAIQTLGGKDVLTAQDLLSIAHQFQDIGVGVMSWEGGEALLRFDDLLMLIRETRGRSESILATTAYGLDADKVQRLRQAGLDTAIISLDHYDPDKHNAFRGNKKAFDMAVNGVRLFRENGVLPSIAICATREIMDEGGLDQYIELAKDIGAGFVQILDATPSGNYLGKDVMLTGAQMREIKDFHIRINTDPRYRDYPSVQARALLEDEEHFGCAAGNALVYVDSSGNLQSCDLLQISHGNVLEEDVATVYHRMREYFPHATRGRCPAQTLHKQIHKVYEKTGALPLPQEECEHILEKIKKRGAPDTIEQVRKRIARTRWRELLPG